MAEHEVWHVPVALRAGSPTRATPGTLETLRPQEERSPLRSIPLFPGSSPSGQSGQSARRTGSAHHTADASENEEAAPPAHFLARSLSPRAFACAVAACDGSSGAFESPPLPLQVIGRREACQMVRRSFPPTLISSPPHSHPLCLAPVHPSPHPY